MALNSFKTTKHMFRNLTASLTTSGSSKMLSSKIIPSSSEKDVKHLKNLVVTVPKPYIFHVELHRPGKLNAFSKEMWMEIKECFDSLSINPECRVIILSGAGKVFTAGIDLNSMIALGQELGEIEDFARKGLLMSRLIKLYQDAITSLEVCTKPVIAAVHSACIGAGVDLITAADIRYSTQDAWFQVKEVQIGMAADVGTLQRLPKVIGSQSLVRELCFTGRKFLSQEAFNCGMISNVFETKDDLLKGALDLAESIAEKSPVAVQATKKSLIYSLDHSNQEGLDQIREMNSLLLLSEDFLEATTAQLTKSEKAIFSKL
ncbi:delta(3,5)-Delta(2,4)-dienoyl-CoA isomerase, mitochondrial-like [Condylostylus longicornis]|uniref:delta(3,5)-Delta(2,4)-dienoyl-CoA isomerase, mitochondrial-like n=1 Tax=Condylostylus longicornis TaxID=2530218 RepID=UPI00244DA963|nr:delta(3,5)-Delta(2,4)-dienoyl-CoA isomerase, mitochondrial-like [Condylostylus longicornis]XP_055371324.1 delta(3,5)-Delta(2,4)-dienoyl-CoA isomerase, mitochondrial-like [Condylostylus longicornis]